MKTTLPRRRRRHDTALARALDAARERARPAGLLLPGEIEGYCENIGCSVREERVRPPMSCPFCGRTLRLHHVRTPSEQAAEDAADAYWTAAFDLLRRRDQANGRLGVVNLGEVNRVAAALRVWTPPDGEHA